MTQDNNMSDVIRHRPRFTEQDAIRLARDLYNLSATAREVASERDQNFHLKNESGEEFMLKIANRTEKEDVLDFQNQAMMHLAKQATSSFIPGLCTTASGEQIVKTEASDGSIYFVRLLTYLPGVPLVHFKPHTAELLQNLGRLLGTMDKALEDLSHPAAQRDLYWDMKNAIHMINDYKDHIAHEERRALVEDFLARFESRVEPQLPKLRSSVIHSDANDHNVLVQTTDSGSAYIAGIVDFGDMIHSYTISELAIAAAYCMLSKSDPVSAAADVVAGYDEMLPLTELELELLFYLIFMRLCMSVVVSAHHKRLEPDNQYLIVSENPAWELLEHLAITSPQLAHYTFRNACNMSPCPTTDAVIEWLNGNRDKIAPVIGRDLKSTKKVIFDLSIGSFNPVGALGQASTKAAAEMLFGQMKAAKARVGIGRYNEARACYTGEIFESKSNEIQESRTIHLGIDLFVEAGSPVFAPLDGTIHSFQNNSAHLDYGPTIIIQHEFENGNIRLFTLYGHLSEDSLNGLSEGKAVKKGEQIARIGDFPSNGDWPPHLHFQLITDMLGNKGDFPGVALSGQRDIWLGICPNPNIILGMREERRYSDIMSKEEILNVRQKKIGSSLSIAYKKPLNIVRGLRQYLYDENGRAYLDAVNNVAHVGHCHPNVVEAAQQQLSVLNTNTRYLHENLAKYAQRLCSKLPEPLRVCYFVCSGSEANELALRLARTHTRRTDIIVVEGGYHGNTSSLVEISPYKFDGPGGEGAPPQVHKVITPDGYRGIYKNSNPEAGKKYANHVQDAIQKVRHENRNIAAFFCESLPSCAGQIVPPEDYLKEAFHHVREAGGVCIADEVQVGFGRVGTHFWGFQTQGVVPDIVTLGKPIGNGHPLAAVVTTPEIAASFDNGMEYFNTFGGNPVSCAVGLAVLEVMENEKLQENALRVGTRMKTGLEGLMNKHPLIGDVRGSGLFIGVELVLDRDTLEPATVKASYVIERMKERGILVSTDGPHDNILKIKPPLVFSEENADFLVNTLDEILSETFLS
jgi:4-aminobutyrate aminotransferase-like enzyme/Ser/Thr protein kinase RdoA (MazF antagonist)